MTSFPRFLKELEAHNAIGYHQKHPLKMSKNLSNWFLRNRWVVPDCFLAFLAEIGYGRFFAGSLEIFSPNGEDDLSMKAWTDKVRAMSSNSLVAIGYDGTTSGCFCFSGKPGDHGVYWFEWAEATAKFESEDFSKWIETLPDQLFIEKAYLGFKKIKNYQAIQKVIESRRQFKIKLLSFDANKTRPPGHENDFLPRYNRVTLAIEKNAETDLKELTIAFLREGSKMGKDNIEYASIAVSDLPVGQEAGVDTYLFDPFNQPFERIVCLFEPSIDLSSRMRAKYHEIKAYL